LVVAFQATAGITSLPPAAGPPMPKFDPRAEPPADTRCPAMSTPRVDRLRWSIQTTRYSLFVLL